LSFSKTASIVEVTWFSAVLYVENIEVAIRKVYCTLLLKSLPVEGSTLCWQI